MCNCSIELLKEQPSSRVASPVSAVLKEGVEDSKERRFVDFCFAKVCHTLSSREGISSIIFEELKAEMPGDRLKLICNWRSLSSFFVTRLRSNFF